MSSGKRAVQDRQPTAVEYGSVGVARRAGRPRDPRLDAAILGATRSLLAEMGYAAMSLESVAAAAGTSLPSVRRRYRSKSDLVTTAIDSLRIAELPTPSGDPRADALTVLRDLNHALLHNNAMTLVGSLLAEQARHPALLQAYRDRLVDSRRAALRRALEEGIRTGQLPTDLDLDAATSMLCGALYGQYLTTAGLDADWADRVLEVLWPVTVSGRSR